MCVLLVREGLGDVTKYNRGKAQKSDRNTNTTNGIVGRNCGINMGDFKGIPPPRVVADGKT